MLFQILHFKRLRFWVNGLPKLNYLHSVVIKLLFNSSFPNHIFKITKNIFLVIH